MLKWMFMPLRRYADFTGRSRRKEYWAFFLLHVIVYGIAIAFFAAEIQVRPDGEEVGTPGIISVLIFMLWGIGTLVPRIAIAVRRFHDQGRSGWLYLISFIPYLGIFVVLVFMALRGESGPNKYGPDPKGTGSITDVFE